MVWSAGGRDGVDTVENFLSFNFSTLEPVRVQMKLPEDFWGRTVFSSGTSGKGVRSHIWNAIVLLFLCYLTLEAV